MLFMTDHLLLARINGQGGLPYLIITYASASISLIFQAVSLV